MAVRSDCTYASAINPQTRGDVHKLEPQFLGELRKGFRHGNIELSMSIMLNETYLATGSKAVDKPSVQPLDPVHLTSSDLWLDFIECSTYLLGYVRSTFGCTMYDPCEKRHMNERA